MKPKITIAVVTYNCSNSLSNTLDSIIAQDYLNKEIVIVDGLSTDGTIDIINSYSGSITSFLSEPDKGIFDAMNKAILLSKGEWIIFMNAGDVFSNNSIVSTAFASDVNESVAVIFGDVNYIRYNKLDYIKARPFFEVKEKIKPMGFSHQSIFTRTSIAQKYPFDLNYKYTADYNMMMSIYKAGYDFKHLNIAIADYDLTGTSTNHKVQQYKEVAHICGECSGMSYILGLLSAYYWQFRSHVKSIIKR